MRRQWAVLGTQCQCPENNRELWGTQWEPPKEQNGKDQGTQWPCPGNTIRTSSENDGNHQGTQKKPYFTF